MEGEEPTIDWLSTPAFSIKSEKNKKFTGGKGVAGFCLHFRASKILEW